jgi:hypothetical protein
VYSPANTGSQISLKRRVITWIRDAAGLTVLYLGVE